MTIECIQQKDFGNYLQSERYLQLEVLPISRHRGWSHFNNPRALPDDVLLINIYENKKLVAYLGILPDDLFLSEKKIHAGWLSCIWVSPKTRGKGFAKALLQNAWDSWDGHIIMTEFTAPAKRLYDRTGNYEDLLFKTGVRCYHQMNLAFLLPKKSPRFQLVKPLLQVFDFSFNVFNNLRLTFYKKNNFPITVKEISKLDSEALDFITKNQTGNLSPKELQDFEWIKNYPWLLNSSEARKDQKHYYFSSYSQRFEFVFLKIFKTEKLVGFLVLAIRNDALKIPFVYLKKENVEAIAKVISNFMLKKRLSTLTLFNNELTNYFKNHKKPFFLVRDFQRHYLISKKIAPKEENKSSVIIQDGDGDCAFT